MSRCQSCDHELFEHEITGGVLFVSCAKCGSTESVFRLRPRVFSLSVQEQHLQGAVFRSGTPEGGGV